MAQHRLVDLTRSLGGFPSRRDVVRGLVGAGLALRAAALPAVAAARKKRKRKRKKVKFNTFGCVDVGEFCRTADQCCSGLCEGKPGKKECRAHDTGGCRPGVQDQTCADPGTNIVCTTSTGNPDGRCNTTTGNAGFCVTSGGCLPCTKDADCQELYGPQAACIHCDDCEQESGGTSCAHA